MGIRRIRRIRLVFQPPTGKTLVDAGIKIEDKEVDERKSDCHGNPQALFLGVGTPYCEGLKSSFLFRILGSKGVKVVS